MEPEKRLVYEQLKESYKPGSVPALSPAVHSYAAFAGGRELGLYSNLRLACSTVDRDAPAAAGAWEPCSYTSQRNYVLNTKTGQIYVRVAQWTS